jgi:hypothetical protein
MESQPGYTFSGATGTYTSITGGTVFANTAMGNIDDAASGAITIPAFTFNCTSYTTLYISTNGYVTFGSAPSTTDYTPISGTNAYSGVLCPFATDLNGAASGTPEIRYQNVAASNEFVIQWQDVSRYSIADRVSFQVRLNYSTNAVSFVYGGTITAANNTTLYPQIGMRGSVNTSFLNRTTTTNWSATTAGGTNTATCQFNQTVKPAAGLAYTFSPSAMTYSSATSTAVAPATIEQCGLNIPMLRIDIVSTGGCQTPLSLTTFSVNMTGVTPTTVVSLVHVYYTGTSSTFGSANEFGGNGLSPAASLTFSGAQVLSSGTNYFWVAYDMNNAGVAANAIGAQMPANPITVGGAVRSLTASPNGTGNFIACSAYPGFTAWYKSDNNVTGNPVSAWNSSTGTYHLTQATASKQPALVSGSTNYKLFSYNKRLNFVSANSSNLSNTGTSPDILGNTGTVFTVLEKGTTNGTAFCYRAGGASSTTDARYQFKPQFRYQSGISGSGTTMDMYGSSHGSYANYFPTEFLSSSAFVNTAISTNTGMSVRINSKSYNACDNCNSSTYYPSLTPGLYIGSNSGTGEFVDNAIAEIITCSATLSTSQVARVESYLALKYGVTLGGNTGTSSAYNYLASDGTIVFNKATNSGYTNDIAGIGRDDGSTLNKKQSISVNISDPVSIGLSLIASENSANAAAFGNDKSFLIWGNNGLTTQATPATSIPLASSTLPSLVQARLARVWKVQATNFGGVTAGDSYKVEASPAVTVGFETGLLVSYSPTTNLRLLVDNDGVDFSNATVYSGAVLNGTRVEFSGVVFSSGQKYFTLASINSTATSLPVKLLTFEAKCIDQAVSVNWTTASENNNDHFDLDRSLDGITFNTITQIPGQNNSIQTHQYQFTDYNAPRGILYYRLKQVDNNSNVNHQAIISIEDNCNSENNTRTYSVYPNPSNDNTIHLSYSIAKDEEAEVKFYDVLGKIMLSQKLILKAGSPAGAIYTNDLERGIYFMVIESSQLSNKLTKIIKQ